LERFRNLLANEVDDGRRALLERLIAKEQEILAGVDDAQEAKQPDQKESS
jgi:hypothetical protein